jgi:hypothetical protein
MKFLMFVCSDPEGEEYSPEADTIEAWVAEGQERGLRTDGDRLRPPDQAKTVRRRGDRVLVTDGPFAETKEWIAGFDVLECESLEDAVDFASRHPMARFGRIEVRAFWPFGEE